MSRQISGRANGRTGLQERWTAGGEQLFHAQARHVKLRPVSVAVSYREIDVLAVEVHMLQRSTDPQVKIWMRHRKSAQTGNQPFAGEVRGNSYVENGRPLQADQVFRCSQSLKGIPHEGQISPPSLRELESASFAFEQFHTKARFQRIHLVADGALRQIELMWHW